MHNPRQLSLLFSENTQILLVFVKIIFKYNILAQFVPINENVRIGAQKLQHLCAILHTSAEPASLCKSLLSSMKALAESNKVHTDESQHDSDNTLRSHAFLEENRREDKNEDIARLIQSGCL